MGASCSQGILTTQFLLYGRRHFTRTGWEKASHAYEADRTLNAPPRDLTGKVYVVTGASSGIGSEMTKYLAGRGGKVYMVCRNKEKANGVARDIESQIAKEKDSTDAVVISDLLRVVVGDCGVMKDMEQVVRAPPPRARLTLTSALASKQFARAGSANIRRKCARGCPCLQRRRPANRAHTYLGGA
jgi:hypothetical protein